MFGNTTIVNRTDSNGVVWAQKQATTKVKPTKAEREANPDARTVTVTTNVGTPYKVLDPNYDASVLLPESEAPVMLALREKYADKLAGNPDQGAINAANLVVGASGVLMAGAVLAIALQEILG